MVYAFVLFALLLQITNKKAQLTPGKRATAVCVRILVFAISPLFDAPLAEERLAISTQSMHH